MEKSLRRSHLTASLGPFAHLIRWLSTHFSFRNLSASREEMLLSLPWHSWKPHWKLGGIAKLCQLHCLLRPSEAPRRHYQHSPAQQPPCQQGSNLQTNQRRRESGLFPHGLSRLSTLRSPQGVQTRPGAWPDICRPGRPAAPRHEGLTVIRCTCRFFIAVLPY